MIIPERDNCRLPKIEHRDFTLITGSTGSPC